MSTNHGPSITTNGLSMLLDAANPKSYIGTGNVWNDISTSRYSFSLQNSPTYNSSNSGYFTFNGTSQSAQVTGTAAYIPSSGFTAMAWIQPSTTASINSIISHQSGVNTNDGWRVTTSTYVRFSLGGVADYVSATAAITTTNWQQIAVTVAGSSIAFFVNGQKYDTQTVGTLSGTPSTIQIGRDQSSSAEFLNGNLSTAFIYNRTLSASEITQNFNAYRGRFGI